MSEWMYRLEKQEGTLGCYTESRTPGVLGCAALPSSVLKHVPEHWLNVGKWQRDLGKDAPQHLSEPVIGENPSWNTVEVTEFKPFPIFFPWGKTGFPLLRQFFQVSHFPRYPKAHPLPLPPHRDLFSLIRSLSWRGRRSVRWSHVDWDTEPGSARPWEWALLQKNQEPLDHQSPVWWNMQWRLSCRGDTPVQTKGAKGLQTRKC